MNIARLLTVMAVVCLLAFVVSTTAGCTTTDRVERTNDAGEVVYAFEAKSKSGEQVRHGEARWWFADGTLAAQGRFKNGRRVGEWSFYYPNGNLRSTGRYRQGHRVGYWRYFSPNKEHRSQMRYLPNRVPWAYRYTSDTPAPEGAYGEGARYSDSGYVLEIAAFEPRLEECYETHIAETERPAGEVLVSISIDSSGGLTASGVTKSDFNHSAFEECIVVTFLGMQFPRPAGGEDVKLNWPLSFPDLGLALNDPEPPESMRGKPGGD